jgi:hypothetical protein
VGEGYIVVLLVLVTAVTLTREMLQVITVVDNVSF